MKLFLTFVAVLLLALGVSLYLDTPGQIIITSDKWTIQTSLIFFVSVAALAFLLLHFVLNLLHRLRRLPENLLRWRKNRRRRLSEEALLNGLTAMLEGRWDKAEALLSGGASYSRTPAINYLAAARAAQLSGAVKKRDAHLLKSYRNDRGGEFAMALMRGELQLEQKQPEQALATLTRLRKQQPGNHHVTRMLLDVQTQLQDWDAILALLSGLKRNTVLSAAQFREKQIQAYDGILKRQTLSLGNMDHTERAEENLHKIWRQLPRKLRQEPRLLASYTREKLKLGAASDCDTMIYKLLKKRWDNTLIELYGWLETKDPALQLKRAENFLPQHAQEPALWLTLGRLSINNRLWGKAKTYLEKSIELAPLPTAYQALAFTLNELGEYETANLQYQKALEVLSPSPKAHDTR